MNFVLNSMRHFEKYQYSICYAEKNLYSNAIRRGAVVVRDDVYYLRYWIMSSILRSEDFNGVLSLLGNHNGEGISRLFRLFGAKVSELCNKF